jgi:nucleotide-binding universal stress UspA family protein
VRKVLLAVDGSTHALSAARWVARLRQVLPDLELHLLSVAPAPDLSRTHGLEREPMHQQLLDLAAGNARSAHLLLHAEGLHHHLHTRLGEPAETIVQTAQQLGCDHIVMGTRGLGAVSRVVLGSVAQGVLHLTEVPVTLVK